MNQQRSWIADFVNHAPVYAAALLTPAANAWVIYNDSDCEITVTAYQIVGNRGCEGAGKLQEYFHPNAGRIYYHPTIPAGGSYEIGLANDCWDGWKCPTDYGCQMGHALEILQITGSGFNFQYAANNVVDVDTYGDDAELHFDCTTGWITTTSPGFDASDPPPWSPDWTLTGSGPNGSGTGNSGPGGGGSGTGGPGSGGPGSGGPGSGGPGSGGPGSGGPGSGGPGDGGPGDGGPGDGGPGDGDGGGGDCPQGMPVWSVSEPFLSLWLADEPLGYQPALGPRISLSLEYAQRESESGRDTNWFSFGRNWNFYWLSRVDLNAQKFAVVSFPGGSRSVFFGSNDYRTHSRLTGNTTTGYCVTFPNGARIVYGLVVTNSAGHFVTAMMTENWNSVGLKTRFDYESYNPVKPVIRLKYVVDGDGLTNTVNYVASSLYSTNLISQVVDPFGRSASFIYDHKGHLTNLTDVIGLSSSVFYNERDYATNLVTPYGSTYFQFTDTTGTNRPPFGRSVRVIQPDGNCHLYLYTNGAPGVASSYSSGDVPDTSPFGNNFDNAALNERNTYHWNRQQYGALSTTNVSALTANDFKLARLKHWLLLDQVSTNIGLSGTLSFERWPSPDGSTEGQRVWYDYDGKTNAAYIGTEARALLEGVVLPEGATRFVRTKRNSLGWTTNGVSTYTSGGSVALRTNIFVFDANEIDLLRATNALGVRVVSNAFNAFHQVVTNFDALDQKTVYTYDSSHRLTSISHPSGLLTTNDYGADGFLAQSAQWGIATNFYTWATNLVATHTTPRGLTVSNTWDALNRLRRVDFPDSTFITNYYDRLDLARVNDRLGFTNSFGYDRLRRLTEATNANGVVSRFGYCSCGSLAYATNAWGTPVELITQNVYDYQGNRLFAANADQTVTNWFDALGRVICTGNELGYRWFYYNNQGLLTVVSNAYGPERVITYDILDRPVYVTDANGVMVTNTYDDLNRLRSRGLPDGGVEFFGYSARGLVAHTNQLSFTNFFAYDEAGRKMFETNANSELIRYTNSPAGDLLALVDGKGQVTKWNYDEYGRVTNKVDQAGAVVLKYTYDADSRLLSRWSTAKGTTYYTSDAVGNLTAVNYPASSDVSYAYDWLNRLTNMVDAVGTTKYTYSTAGRLLTEDGPFANDSMTNTYLNGLRTGLTLQQPTGLWTNQFSYDGAGRLTNVTSPAGAFGYALAGPATRLTQKLFLPNTSYITNTYDAVARLTGTWLKKSDDTTLDAATYGYNVSHQRITFTNAAGTWVTNSYDLIGQLKIANSSVNTEDRGYLYDTAWNLSKRTNNGVVTSLTVNIRNDLTKVGTADYANDGNGNRLSIREDLPWYEYDDENQLSVVENDGDGWRTELVYDGLRRLRQRSEYTGTPGSWTLAATTRYLYDGMRVIQERDGSDVPTVSYTRGTDLSGTLAGAGGIGGLLARSDNYSGGNWTLHDYYHADGNGNVTALVDLSQVLSASYRYDPFGNTISASGALAGENVYRFSSKEIHVNSGLYSFGRRFYDPNTQRWLNRDPIEERGGINLYGMVMNDPAGGVDPEGEWLMQCVMALLLLYEAIQDGMHHNDALIPAGPVFGADQPPQLTDAEREWAHTFMENVREYNRQHPNPYPPFSQTFPSGPSGSPRPLPAQPSTASESHLPSIHDHSPVIEIPEPTRVPMPRPNTPNQPSIRPSPPMPPARETQPYQGGASRGGRVDNGSPLKSRWLADGEIQLASVDPGSSAKPFEHNDSTHHE